MYPDQDFKWRMGFTFGGDNITVNETELAFIIKTVYNDKSSGNIENQIHWVKYIIGGTSYFQLSIQSQLVEKN